MDSAKAAGDVEFPPGAKQNSGTALPGGRRTRLGRRKTIALVAVVALALATPSLVVLGGDSAPGDPATRSEKAPGPVGVDEAVRRAAVSGKDVQVTAWHTSNSTTWAQPDGMLRTRTYSDTVRARVDGGWKPIDTSLREVEGGYAPRAVNDPLLFSGGSGSAGRAERASRGFVRPALGSSASNSAQVRAGAAKTGATEGEWSELVRLSTGGHDVVVSWPGPLPQPVVSGPRALYEDIRPDIDLLLTARDSGFSHVLIVQSREAAQDPLLSDLRYLLESASLTFQLDEASSSVSAQDSEGREMAAAPTPYLWDSAGEPAVTLGEDSASASPDPAIEGTALTLPGLAGPQPGTNSRPLGAGLAKDGTLTIEADPKALADPDLVYPLFLDPSFKGRKKNWTLLYESARTSSFWNGQNFNDGTNEARVGYESTTGGLSRSVFTFEFSSKLHGASIKSAKFQALQTYSWGCAPRKYHVYLTGVISSSTTWANQPGVIDYLSSGTNGHGYKAGTCPDKWVAHDVKSAAQLGATKKLSTLTMGLRAADERDHNAWKKFLANGESSPYLEIVYNRAPALPTSQTMTPGPDCDLASPYERVGKSSLTFRAKGSDPDGNLKYLNFRLWITGQTKMLVDKNVTPDSKGYAHHDVNWNILTDGATYSWDVRSVDTEGAVSTFAPAGTLPCRFIADLKAPEAPAVSSEDFPESDASDGNWPDIRFGQSGKFTLSGATGATRFEYGVNDTRLPSEATATGGSATLTVAPPQAGPNVLYVQSVDGAGNRSARTSYHFLVAPRTQPDAPGDTAGDGHPDLLLVDEAGRLRAYPGNSTGDLHDGFTASYDTGTGQPEPVPDEYWENALITHNGDWIHGDGVQDLVARMPDGKLYVYPGDGFSGFDVARRMEILLPSNVPPSSQLTQILSVGDADGDGLPDLFARYGPQLWAISGYTGASFATAHQLTASAWDERDIVLVDDVTGDGTADLVYRTHGSGRLILREGKADGSGTDLLSLATAAASRNGTDAEYGTGWSPAERPLLMGTPDVNGDSIPDIWAEAANGDMHVYTGGRSSHAAARLVINADGEGTDWSRPRTLG